MLRLLGVLLLVPVISFVVAYTVLLKFNSEWSNAVQSQIVEVKLPSDTQSAEYAEAESTLAGMRLLQAIPLTKICSDSKLSDMWTGCDDVQAVALMRLASVMVAAIGIGLVVLIALAARLSRFSRRLLLFVFRPGLYITIITLSGLILANAGLVTGAIYYGEGALLGQIQTGLILVVGIGAIAGTFAMIKGALSTVKDATMTVVGKRQNLNDNIALKGFLETLADKVGTTISDNVIVGLTPNFFVTEASVRCLDGLLTGRSLYISLPLARILTKEEMASVLGHELGHYEGQDTAFSRRFYPIYRGTAQSLAGLAASVGQGARGAALIPALFTLSFFYTCFSSAESRLGRERELHADATGARVTSPRTIAVALLKVCTFAPMWDKAVEQMKQALSEGKQFINISALWASFVAQLQTPSIFEGVNSQRLTHPADSHPPLGLRLNKLGFTLAELESDALKTAPTDSAVELIADYEALEKELTDVEHYLLKDSVGGISEPEVKEPSG